MFREKEICDAIRTAYLHLFPDKKERKRALSRLDLELVAQGAIAGKASLPTRLPAAMRVPWTITGRSCFPSGDAAFIKKRSKVIPRRWMPPVSGNYGSWMMDGLWRCPA